MFACPCVCNRSRHAGRPSPALGSVWQSCSARPLCAQWPPPQGLSPEHPTYGRDPKEPPELGILHPSISVCHGSFTTHSFVLCCSVWGLPFEEVSSCTPRPTRCLAHGDAHGGPACWGPGRGPPPPCPAPGSRHSARRAASPGGGPWRPVPQVGRLAPREAQPGFAPRPGSPLCIRQPLALERQSRMPDACPRPPPSAPRARGDAPQLWRKGPGRMAWLRAGWHLPHHVSGLRTLSWRGPHPVYTADLDGGGSAGWKEGLPGPLDQEVGHVSTLCVSWGNDVNNSFPALHPGGAGVPGNCPLPLPVSGPGSHQTWCSLGVAEGATGPSG